MDKSDPKHINPPLLVAAEALEVSDPLGQRVHHWAAVLGGLLISWPTTIAEFALAPAVVAMCIRIGNLGPLFAALVRTPIAILAIAFTFWTALSIAWSPDPGQGADELLRLRWFLFVPALAPITLVEHRRRALLWAAIAGIALGHVPQALNIVGHTADIAVLKMGRLPNRLSGWWDPAVTGTLLTFALGLSAPLALGGRGRARIIVAITSVAALVGVLASGARGGWLGSAALLGILIPAAFIFRVTGLRARNLIIALIAVAVLGGGATTVLWPKIESRATTAVDEVSRALNNGDYDTDTGLRILMKKWSYAAWKSAPVHGVGAGGYQAWVQAEIDAGRNLAPDSERTVHAHAHDTPMHVGATQGVVGVALLTALLGACMLGGVRIARVMSAQARTWTIHAGPPAAVLGLILITPFDTITVSTQSAALLGLGAALCVAPLRKRAA